MSGSNREFLYIADPMCSWCWGFSPVITALREQFNDAIGFRLVVGGLRVGTREPLPDNFKKEVLHHWHEVQKQTGQPFCFDFNLPEEFRYDTEPACRAAVTVRRRKGESVFEYLDALHRAFYVDNRDLTNPDILAELAEPFGVDREAFLETFSEKETKQATFEDFSTAYGYGVQGFPSAILNDARGSKLLTIGYQPLQRLVPIIEQWLTQGAEPATA